jgi:thymidylate kinase
MIIELFGAPGAGKTTLAGKLATRLRQDGHQVDLMLSFRPAESGEARSASPLADLIQRLIRPVGERLAVERPAAATSANTNLASALLDLLPAKNLMWSVRLRQYATRLEASWMRAAGYQGIVIVDQGFVQLVCSLVLLGRASNEDLAARALEIIPHADLLIWLDAPEEVLRERLRKRSSHQSWLERQLELDTDTNLRSIGIVRMLDDILCQQGRPVLRVACPAQGPRADTMDRIGVQINDRMAVIEQVLN